LRTARVRDVGLVELGDVRNRVPGVREVLARPAPDARHRLALDGAPFREVGQRKDRGASRAAAAPAAAAEAAITAWQTLRIVLRDAAAGSVPATW
jgi:hypothetical protein